MKVSKYRDLSLLEMENRTLVVACDSNGGIGSKEGDIIKVDTYTTARYTLRVVLMELFSFGAKASLITNCVCGEMHPTASEMIRGLLDEMALVGIGEEHLTGSTEENTKTIMTAVGITAIGYIEGRFTKTMLPPNTNVICVGKLKVGNEIKDCYDKEIVSYEDIRIMRSLGGVHEIVPVGSKGVFYEADNLAKMNDKIFIPTTSCDVDLYKSAGPATACLAFCDDEAKDEMLKNKKAIFIGNVK